MLLLFLASLTLIGGMARATTEEAEKHLQTAVNEVITAADHTSSSSALETTVRPILEKNISPLEASLQGV